MRLKRTFGSHRNYGNKPHRGEGQFGRAHQMGGLMAGAHMPERLKTGYDDSRGNKEGGRISPKDKPYRTKGHPGIDQEARLNAEVTSKKASERRDGRHTGKPSKGDTNVRKGPTGNSKGSSVAERGKGSLASHKGTAGRGGAGELNQVRSNRLSESMSHEQFEKLGA